MPTPREESVEEKKYNPSFKNAVTGILSLPGEIGRQTGITDAVKAGGRKVAENLQTNLGVMGDAAGKIARSATGQVGAQLMSDKYVNPPGGTNTGGALTLTQPSGPTMWTGGVNTPGGEKTLPLDKGVPGTPPNILPEPATDRPERTPIETGAMGRAKTVEDAMGKINAMGANQPERLPDTIIEQPGASQTNLRKWTDDQGRVHIEGGNIGGPDAGAGAPGGGGEYAAATMQVNAAAKGIDDLVNSLLSRGDSYYKVGGVKKSVQATISKLLGDKTGMLNQQTASSAAMEGHGVNARINKDTRMEVSAQRHEEAQGRLAETKRANDLHSADLNMRVQAQKDQKEADRLQRAFERGAVYETDPMTGTKSMNKKLTFFNMAESGETIHDKDTKADVEKIAKEFDDYFKTTLKLNSGLPNNAATRRTIKSEWMKRQLTSGQ